MPGVRVNGVRLHYSEHGQGQPILLVHGCGGSALGFDGAVGELARIGRVIAYDRRGSPAASGRSPTSARA